MIACSRHVTQRERCNLFSLMTSVTINLHIELKSEYLDKNELASWQSDSYLTFCLLDSNNSIILFITLLFNTFYRNIYLLKETHYDRNHWWFIFDFFYFVSFCDWQKEMHYDNASNRLNFENALRSRQYLDNLFQISFILFSFILIYLSKETHYDRNHWWFYFRSISIYFQK